MEQQNSIVTLLAKLGHHPVRKSGKEHIYHSPLRDDDHKATFTVDDEIQAWYDHGTAQGGNYHNLAVKLGLEKPKHRPRKKHATKLPNYLVEEVKETSNNPHITQYLQQRGIWKQRHQLKEIYYYVQDEKQNQKHFYAAGSRNDHGGWEVRSKNYKGTIGKKAITTITGNPGKATVFREYFDYLSWLSENHGDNATIITLNNTELSPATLKIINSYATINTYFPHDPPGRANTKTLLHAIPQAKDRSNAYYGFNDYNEKIMAYSTNSKS